MGIVADKRGDTNIMVAAEVVDEVVMVDVVASLHGKCNSPMELSMAPPLHQQKQRILSKHGMLSWDHQSGGNPSMYRRRFTIQTCRISLIKRSSSVYALGATNYLVFV